jgi:hypothetical protein
MKGKTEAKRFCGNCDCHNACNYPDEVFCMRRFLEKKDPIVKTLWHCEDWNSSSQQCNCVEDASKKEKR